MKRLLLIISLLSLTLPAGSQIITTVAGSGTYGFSGDGGPATAAQLSHPEGIAIDPSGSIFICDNKCVRKVSPAAGGTITTFAGVGTSAGYSGDGGPAISAEVNGVHDIAVDRYGNVYLADGGNNRVRKVTADGVINTIAGTGMPGYNGDGIAATAAQLNSPYGVAVDDTGNVYIADMYNRRIRKVNTAGIISTIAGTGVKGFSGDGGMADIAMLHHPIAVELNKSGEIFIADSTRIRKISTLGIISTVAGVSTFGFSGDGGPASSAEIIPLAIAFDSIGNIYIADDDRIRRIDTAGIINTIAGTGFPTYNGDGIDPLAANLWSPSGVALNAAGEILIGDKGNCRIRKIGKSTDAVVRVQISLDELKISPNPSNGTCKVFLQYPAGGEAQIAVTKMYGAEVLRQTIPVNKEVIVSAPWPAGVYVVSAYIDGRRITTTLTVK